MQNIIAEAKNISVEFSSKSGALHKAVSNISFSLKAGDTLAVVGESGSGKTTLLRVLLGLAELSHGSVTLFGRDIKKVAAQELAALRRRCGYVPQDPYGALPPGLSVIEAVAEPEVIAQRNADRETVRLRAEALLGEVGLQGQRLLNSRAVGLSGGQRQRVELARALMLSPELLLCDEPTSMQDVSTRGDIIKILDKYVANGMSMIFVTHDLMLAGRAAERIMVMKNGELCEEGMSDAVLAHPSQQYTKALIDAIPKLTV